jgi:hypothetical protein
LSDESEVALSAWFKKQTVAVNNLKFLDCSGIPRELGQNERAHKHNFKRLFDVGIYKNKRDALIARLLVIPI